MYNMPAVPKALTEQEVECRIRIWHTSATMDADISLDNYLGWTEEEYWHWVMTNELPSA